MNSSKKFNFPITNIGSVTLMMIFIVLCMVSFAALSLSTAASDYQASQKSAKHVKEYYHASNQAEETLASIDMTLSDDYQHTTDMASYFSLVRSDYADTPDFTLTEDNGKLVISYQTPLNNKQALTTSLQVQYPSKGASENDSGNTSENDGFYKIISWQVVSTTEWNGDNSVKLIGE